MSSRHVRAYRVLLRTYPRRFRSAYRDEMARLFADQLRDVRATEGTAGVIRLWLRSLVDLALTAPGEHLEPEVLEASPVGASPASMSARRRSSPAGWVVLALLPLWTLIALLLLAPGFMDPFFVNPPGILGLPMGIFALALSLGWMGLGLGVLSFADSIRARFATIWLFSVPATALILIAPATILIVLNLNI